jgi:hypothetical protein
LPTRPRNDGRSLGPGAPAELPQLDHQGREQAEGDNEYSQQHASAPAHPEAQIPPVIGRDPAAVVHDEDLFLGDNGDDR